MAGAALPQQCGNYELVREIGRGASSEVWLGRHVTIDDHTVALKILLAQDDEAVQRFEREARIAARLSHPSIARLLDFGFVHPYHYAAYELIDGKPLRSLMNSDRPLDPVLALRIFRQTAAALSYAHRAGVVHRDVSPGNILLTDYGARVVLIDFGIARSGESDLTIVGALLGTRGYFAPEALLSPEALDERSDVFSLGVVLYQMLSGRLPWLDNALGRRSERSLEALYPPPPGLRELGITALPTDFDRVLQTMLAVDPERRYASMQAALDDAERVLARSHSSRTLLASAPDDDDEAVPEPEADEPPGFRSNGLVPGDVERALGAELQREPLDRANARAEQLRDPQAVADLLNRWSAARPLRRRLLGRLARLHLVTSRNISFFRVRALIEERRAVPPLEQPYDGAHELPERVAAVDIWQIALPSPGVGQPQTGRVVLAQTARRSVCDACDGSGEQACPRCGGVPFARNEADDETDDRPEIPALPRGQSAQLPLGFAAADDDDADELPELPQRQPSTTAARPPLVPAADDPYALPPGLTRGRSVPPPTDRGLAALLSAHADEIEHDDDEDPPLPPLRRSGSGDYAGDGQRLPATARLLNLVRRPARAEDGPCRSCDGSGMLPCARCDGSGELALTDAFVWSRRTLLLHENSDIPSLDRRWLARHCQAVTIYEAEASAPRPAWLQIPEVAALFDEIEQGLGAQRRLIHCELAVSIVPLTEITFDLGSDAEADRYRLAIYGFEQRIPADWRFLDWGRVVLLILTVVLTVLLAVAWLLR